MNKPFPEPDVLINALIKHLKLYDLLRHDLLSNVDSILAEAGDPRAPVCEKHIAWRQEIVQGWLDRLRGVRAAIRKQESK